MSRLQLCLFASTPEMAELDFVVKVLTGSPADIAQRAVDWGYDGIEFMPDPEDVPDPAEFARAVNAAGAVMSVVNSGRMAPQGLALLHEDREVRERSIRAYKDMLDFAGYFGARVGLGVARGAGIPGATREEMDQIAGDVFRELTEHAEDVGATIILEPADPGITSYINTVADAVEWVERIDSPAFSVMLDTYQLVEVESSIEQGIKSAQGLADHIHLYDPSRWPPGVLPANDRLDWPHIVQVLRDEGFEGTGSVVLAPEGDPEPAARTAAAYLRDLFDGE